MSRPRFIVDSNEDNIQENINSTRTFSPDSFSHSRQGWQYLIKRIFENKFDDELKIIQSNLNSNIFQQYGDRHLQKYKIREIGRTYHVNHHLYHQLPTEKAMKSIMMYTASIVQFSNISTDINRKMITPSTIQQDTKLVDQIEQKQKTISTEKFPTIIRPKSSTQQTSNNLSNKQISFVENNSLLLSSPRWRSSIDEEHAPSYNSNIEKLIPTNPSSTDDVQQTKLLSSFHKHHQYSSIDVNHDTNLSRLSLRSISYGFGLGIKTFRTTNDENSAQQKSKISPSNYQLPSNKIELDINQQEMIRRTLSMKRKSDTIS